MIDTSTIICGIIGNPIKHSLSPAIHNAAAKHYNLNAVFLAFETRDPKGAVLAMRALSIRELTVTIPYKETVMRYVDKVSRSAKELGNINTIINNDGILTGYNTDIDGIAASLKGITIKNRRVVILGAGGAAKTICFYVAKKGGEVYIANRDDESGKCLARKYGGHYEPMDDLDSTVRRVNPHIIINATPVGMGSMKGQTLIKGDVLKLGMVAFDVIYNPKETRFMQEARLAGCRVIGGKIMFLSQGARQFELWSGKRAPRRVMERAFEKALFV